MSIITIANAAAVVEATTMVGYGVGDAELARALVSALAAIKVDPEG